MKNTGTGFDSEILNELLNTEMPFGKYKGQKIYELPEFYLVWFHNKGFPKGKLGMLLSTLYEIKLNGLEFLLKPLIEQQNKEKKSVRKLF